MKNNYKFKTQLTILVMCFMMVFPFVSKAQISAYTFAETTEAYTPVVGTNSTATGDDGSQNAIPLGFTFNFGGTAYTTFSVNTNGFIRLGANIAATSWTNNIATGSTQNPLIAALWDDNNRNAGSIQYSLTGTTPNQILEIGWDGINIGGGGATSGTNVASFKIRLYETTNVIEIIYGGTMNTAGALSASIGLSSTGGFHSATPGAPSTSSNATANNAIAATTDLVGKKFVYTPPLPPACAAPTAALVTPTGPTTADVTWTCVACTGTFTIEYGPAGFTPGTGATPGAGGTIASAAAVSPFNLTGLSSSAVTDVYIRQDCGGSGFSANTTVAKFIPGDVCANAIDLGLLISPLSSTTTGANNNFTNTCAGGNTSPDLVYTIQVPDLYTLVIGQTVNGYDSENTLFYGGACPGTTQIACFDDPDYTNTTWQNTTGSTQTVYWVQDGYFDATNNGTFTLAWTLTAPPACPAPTALSATAITTTGATLNWNCPSCTGTYSIEYGPTGFTLGTGTTVTSGVSSVAITGLTAGTTYQFYVTQDCSVAGDGFSTVSGPASFTTVPLGDNVCGAIALAFGTNGPYNSAGTTVEIGEPAAPAGGCNTQTTWCNNTLNGSTWFTFVAPVSGRVSIAAPGFDDQIALYSAPNCAAILSGGSTLIAANDDGAGLSAIVNPVNCLTPGVTYYVQVDQYSATTGTFTVVLTDLGAADPSFTGLAATYCDNAAVATLTPAVTGGVFAGTGVTGSTFNPTTAGAGTYSVTYTLNGCYTSTQSVIVNASPVATSVITTPVLCNGGNATVTVSATSGTPSYTGTGAFTAPAGAYTYTVTDANSCSSTTTGTITQPTAVTVTPTSTAILCNGGTSSVTIVATGGTPTYTGEGTFTQSAGTTVYTVTDANSCVGTASVVITEPSVLVVNPTSSAILCNGGTSTVTILASGGTPSYTGQGTFSQLAGTTVYTVTDANACTATASVVVTEPTPVVATNSSTSILCNGGTATVTVVATGGTPSYTGTGAFTQSSGTVVYTVMDANGCSTTTSATLTEPTAVVVSYSETGVLCNGGTSSVTISATGGTPAYTGTGTFTQSAGTTNYVVADANGCSTSTNITVTEPAALAATSSSTAILCNGGTSTVTVLATGGTTPYTGDGSFTQSAGTTVYTVTDANGCTTTVSETITEPTAVMVMFTSTPILCNGGTSSVTITGMDGTPTYTGEGTFTQSAGTTVYTVTDANACTGTASVVITEPAAIATAQTVNFCGSGSVTVGTSTYTAAGTYTDVLTAANTCDSTVTTTVTITNVDVTTTVAGAAITANSTTGTYVWLDCNAAYAPITPAETNQVYNTTANGSYAVEVTDNGCVDTSACVVISTTGIDNNEANVVSVYPNPTMGMFNIAISNANIAELVITIVDIQGKEVFSSVDKNVNGAYNKQINLDEIAKGLYYIKMNTGAEVKIQKLIVQ